MNAFITSAPESMLDAATALRPVLCLFEGGASGAADGYARMTGRPAAVLLHLGPGFANGWANLHNARKAGAPMVVVVGDHARRHLAYDAPLTSDLEGVARSVADWVRRAEAPQSIGLDAAAAVAAARSAGGRLAVLILPADVSWSEGAEPAAALAPAAPLAPDAGAVAAAAAALRAPGAAFLVGGPALHGALFEQAAGIAAATGARLMVPFFCPRLRDGAGAPVATRLAYGPADCAEVLADVTRLVLVGERYPVSFFAYPGTPSSPLPPGCAVTTLAAPGWDLAAALGGLARAVAPGGLPEPPRHALDLPRVPHGPITPESLAAAVLRRLPEEAIVSNEGITEGFAIWDAAGRARGHDRLDIMGGAIGQGLPAAAGAAIACPGRRVVAVVGDGSAMYTLQSLWTMARERLDVTVLILANRGYQILRREMAAMGAQIGPSAARLFDVTAPGLDFVALAEGHGMQGLRVETAEALDAALADSFGAPGPRLIEAVMAPA